MQNFRISYYLPGGTLDNEELAGLYKNWTAEKIYEKTGIKRRRISAAGETASDMAVSASEKLFQEYGITPGEIEFIILATQNPDYALPTTACIVQDRLRIPKTAGALDINLGCSAYIYGLALAKSMLENETINNILFITSETYTKRIHPMDKSIRTLFGDGASATFLDRKSAAAIGKFVFGTDGSKFDKLIIPLSGAKSPQNPDTLEYTDNSGNTRSPKDIFMDGPEIFNFTISAVPESVKNALIKNALTMEDIDLFVFHQANKFMLEYLRKIIKIPEDKFYVDLEDTGNTVSTSVPLALKKAEEKNILQRGDKVLLAGFGVGLSWGASVIEW